MPAGTPAASGPVQSHWLWVLCLIGLDYFSTLGYQPSIAYEAAGPAGPHRDAGGRGGYAVLCAAGLCTGRRPLAERAGSNRFTGTPGPRVGRQGADPRASRIRRNGFHFHAHSLGRRRRRPPHAQSERGLAAHARFSVRHRQPGQAVPRAFVGTSAHGPLESADGRDARPLAAWFRLLGVLSARIHAESDSTFSGGGRRLFILVGASDRERALLSGRSRRDLAGLVRRRRQWPMADPSPIDGGRRAGPASAP